MFSQKLLKAALAALAAIEISNVPVQATTSPDDIANYPEFAAAMQAGGWNYGWASQAITTATGYQILMFHIVSDELGTPLVATKGPAVFLHGMFSDPVDFLSRSDLATPATPIQLAQQGFDVYIACTRGRSYTLGHDTIDRLDPLQMADYWDFSFDEIGREDVRSIVDTVVSLRNDGDSCHKVTLITHSTGANQALVAAVDDSVQLSEKVGQII